MDMYAMATAVNAAAAANAAARTQPAQEGSSSEVSFAQLLLGMAGVGGNGTATEQLGLTWREVQAGMLSQAMETIQDAERPVVTDPMLAQLLEMMQSLAPAGGEQPDAAQLTALVERMQKRLQQIMEENGAAVAGQQALALLGTVLPQAAGAPAEAAATNVPGTGVGQSLLEAVVQSDPQELTEILVGKPAERTVSAEPLWQAPGVQPLTKAGASAPRESVVYAEGLEEAKVQTGGAQLSLPLQGGEFGQAVRAAKQMMAQTPDGAAQGNTAAPQQDMDALQQRIDAGIYLQNTPLAQQPAPAAATPEMFPPAPQVQLAEQIATGITQGSEQITVTLRPQELGEVVVQLTRVGEGIALNIITQNPETQSLLAAQMDSLRENLRPLNVEVASILSQQQFAMMAGGQNFGGQHQRNFVPMRGAAYYGDEPLGQSAPDAAPALQAVAARNTLDTYI